MKQEKVDFWRVMWEYIRAHKHNLLIAVLCSMAVGVCIAVQPLVIKYIVDNGIEAVGKQDSEKLRYIIIMCAFYAGIGLFRVSVWALGLKNMLKTMESAIFGLRAKFFRHVQQMGMRFYDTKSTGEIYNCILGSPINNVRDYMRQVFINVPHQLMSFTISIIALFSYDAVLTVILLVTAFVMAVCHFLSRRRIRMVSNEYVRAEMDASSYLADTLHGIDAITMYSVEDDTDRNVREKLDVVKNKSMRVTFLQSVESLKPEFVQYCGTAVVYLVGAAACIYRGVSIGVLYAFLSSMGNILGVLISWMTLGLLRSSADSGLYKILAVLAEKPTTPEYISERMPDISVERDRNREEGRACIALRKVDFAYDEKKIFDDFSCRIGYNESVALVGGSGSGKSTLTKLLMRLYDVDSGNVYVHGRDVRDYRLHDLRKSFGIVPQNPFIFRGTIWDNVRIACPDAENSDIINAMEIARMHEFVNELPNGWNTQIGDGALNLSGGQKQRIAIARAVLGNPDILIFDEATSALDNISERHIQQAMEELMKTHTVIIVAHRLTTIKNVDRILVFKNGKVVEEGSYSELENAGGVFSELLHFRE